MTPVILFWGVGGLSCGLGQKESKVGLGGIYGLDLVFIILGNSKGPVWFKISQGLIL